MTSPAIVREALELCPFCGGEDHCADVWEVDDPTLGPEDQTPRSWGYGCSCSVAIGPFDSEESAVAAWRVIADTGMERAAKWHDERARQTPDAFESEFHEVSARAIRAISANPSLTALAALDATPGEGEVAPAPIQCPECGVGTPGHEAGCSVCPDLVLGPRR